MKALQGSNAGRTVKEDVGNYKWVRASRIAGNKEPASSEHRIERKARVAAYR